MQIPLLLNSVYLNEISVSVWLNELWIVWIHSFEPELLLYFNLYNINYSFPDEFVQFVQAEFHRAWKIFTQYRVETRKWKITATLNGWKMIAQKIDLKNMKRAIVIPRETNIKLI